MSGEKDFTPWRLDWNPSNIKNFWDWWGSNPALTKHYFSKRNGESILNKIRYYVRFSGVVVDLGAGPGYIVELLLKRGVNTLAVDTSAESLAILEERVAEYPNFLGTKVSSDNLVSIEDQQVDGVLLVETIEHLGNDVLIALLQEVYRIVKPGGWVAITTPNDENLNELETICPDCGCIYHSYQHLRSWSVTTLEKYMLDVGFSTIVCHPTLFSSLSYFLRPLHKIAYLALRKKLPHLIYIGKV